MMMKKMHKKAHMLLKSTPYKAWGTPLPRSAGWGYHPPPSRRCEQTENITFRHPSDASGDYKVYIS